MNRQHWSRRIGIAALILGLAAMGTALLSAKPPPKPGPHHRPGPKVRKAARHRHRKLPPKLRKAPRHRPVLVRRAGPAVVVRQGETVIRRGPAVVVRSAGELQTAPTRDFSEAAAYKIVRVADDCSSVVLTREGKQQTVRLLGVAPIGEPDKTGSRFVRNLLMGEFVYLDYDATLAQEDEAGQTVAYLYRAPDGMFLNLEIVRQGYGLAPDYYSYQHDKLFRFYQQKAEADGKGIWASVAAAKPPVEEKTPSTAPPGTL